MHPTSAVTIWAGQVTPPKKQLDDNSFINFSHSFKTFFFWRIFFLSCQSRIRTIKSYASEFTNSIFSRPKPSLRMFELFGLTEWEEGKLLIFLLLVKRGDGGRSSIDFFVPKMSPHWPIEHIWVKKVGKSVPTFSLLDILGRIWAVFLFHEWPFSQNSKTVSNTRKDPTI